MTKPYNWTAEELELLRAKAPTTRVRDLATLIGRSKFSICGQLMRLEIHSYNPRTFTPAEIEAVRQAKPGMRSVALSHSLGRSVAAVHRLARRMGVTLAERPQWSPALADTLKGMDGLTVAEAAVKTGRSERSCEYKAARLGVTLTAFRRTPVAKKTVVSRQSSVVSEKRKPLRQAPVRQVRFVEYCAECGSPVSNWGQHYERMGHRRRA